MHRAGNLSAFAGLSSKVPYEGSVLMEFICTGGLHFIESDIYIRTSFFHLAVLLDKDLEYFPDSIRFLLLLTGPGSAFSGIE
jgi:hypothetical protein